MGEARCRLVGLLCLFSRFAVTCILLRVMFRSPNVVTLALSPAPVATLGTKWVSFGCSDHL